MNFFWDFRSVILVVGSSVVGELLLNTRSNSPRCVLIPNDPLPPRGGVPSVVVLLMPLPLLPPLPCVPGLRLIPIVILVRVVVVIPVRPPALLVDILDGVITVLAVSLVLVVVWVIRVAVVQPMLLLLDDNHLLPWLRVLVDDLLHWARCWLVHDNRWWTLDHNCFNGFLYHNLLWLADNDLACRFYLLADVALHVRREIFVAQRL